jgi:hypothetical protein
VEDKVNAEGVNGDQMLEHDKQIKQHVNHLLQMFSKGLYTAGVMKLVKGWKKCVGFKGAKIHATHVQST